MRERGFTLLEVVIALAILALSATAILGAGAQALNTHVYAKRISIISWLARSKMTDLEQRLYDKPLNTTDEESNGDFEAEGWPDIKWRARILVPKTTSLDPAQLASVLFGIPVEALSLGERDGGKPDGPPAARDGGSSSLSALGPLASMAETQGTNVLQQLGRSLREIRLIVSWNDGSQDDSLTLVTHVLSNGPGSDLNRTAFGGAAPPLPAPGRPQ